MGMISWDGWISSIIGKGAELAMEPMMNSALGGLAGPKEIEVLGKTLTPLEPIKNKINVVHGLFQKRATGQGSHPAQTGATLSGAAIQKGALLAAHGFIGYTSSRRPARWLPDAGAMAHPVRELGRMPVAMLTCRSSRRVSAHPQSGLASDGSSASQVACGETRKYTRRRPWRPSCSLVVCPMP